jgi:chromosome segregation ATPase
MTKFSDIFERKPGEAGDKIIPLTPISARSPGHPDTGTLNGTGIPIDIGSLGHENEMLRNLLSDAGRRIGELDELKLTFERLVSPFNIALRSLEQERSRALDLAARLDEQRSAYETLRGEFYAVEKKATLHQADAEKLRSELEVARAAGRVAEGERLELVEDGKAKNVQIAELTRQLEQETAQSRSANEARRALQEQTDRAEKRIVELEGELAAARERLALLEDEKQSLQNNLDQALGETARLNRRMTESENMLTATRTQLGKLEASYAEAYGERGRLAAALDEAKELHQSERNTLTMRFEAMQSRAATAERLLAEARQNLIARTEEVRAFDRKAVEASIARTTAERRLAQVEAAQDARERHVRDLEAARHALTESNAALSKALRSREMALARAEDKVAELTARNAQLEADLQVSRASVDKRVEELQSALERERLDRAVAEGALEGARKDNERLYGELTKLRSSLRHGAAPVAQDEAPPEIVLPEAEEDAVKLTAGGHQA